MRKLMMFVVLAVLVSLAVFVSAATMINKSGAYEVTVHLSQGWNLIAGTVIEDGILKDSDIGLNDIDAMWYYSPLQKKYIEVYPNTDWGKINQDDEDFVLTNAMWIYSRDSGNIKYSTLEDYPSLENRQLYSGWNLVSMTPDMVENQENPDLTFEEIRGNCNVEKAYYFFDGNWALFDMPEMDSTLLGKGMAIKVTNDCTLGSSEGDGPPGLPGGDNIGLRKNIENYFYEEFSYESCESNEARGYTSEQDCKTAWRCIAQDYAKLIPEGDLQDLADYMAEHGGESGSVYYSISHPNFSQQLEETYDLCLAGKHEDY